jgi:restriction endonuclease, S subunit
MWYKLSDLFDLQMGKTPSRNNPNYWNSKDYLWVSISDMSGYDKYVSSAKEYISERAVKESGIKTIPANTVIMSFKLSIGKTAITTESIFSNEAIMAFIDKKTTAIDPEYIFYLFSGKDWDEGSNKAVMGKTLNKVTLSNTEVDIPSLDIQKERVDKLNKISTLIADKKQQLNQLDELVKARFVEMFGENDATSKVLIGDAVELINGRAFKPTDWTPTGLPIIRIQNLNDTKAPYNYFYGAYDKKNYIKSGELLFSWSGTPGTSFGAFIWNRGPGLLNQHIFRVLPKKDYDLNFLRFALNAQLDEIISKAHGGVGLQHITKSELEKIAIPYPNRKLQAAFSAFVAQIDKLKFALQNSIKSLMNLWYNIN